MSMVGPSFLAQPIGLKNAILCCLVNIDSHSYSATKIIDKIYRIIAAHTTLIVFNRIFKWKSFLIRLCQAKSGAKLKLTRQVKAQRGMI